MLHSLNIQNFTIIDELTLEFKSGMTVLTGETGAGKSILIDALLLALGDRTDSKVIRTDSERCVVNATFAIQQLPAAQQWLSSHELVSDDECLLRRIITADGRSKAFINGQVVPLQLLRELGNILIGIHGQHEHQALLKPDKQRVMLDAYAGHGALCKKVQNLYQQWRKTQEALQTLQTQNSERSARSELLRYQVNELDKLALQADELIELDKEQRQLANADRLLENCQTAISLLGDNEDGNALTLLNTIHQQLLTVQNIDPKINNTVELINSAIIAAQEAESELRHYLDQVELNPERLNWVEQRLSAIHDVARKHRVAPAELCELHTRFAQELNQLENHDVHLQQLQQELTQFAQAYLQAAAELSLSRQRATQRLMPLVEKSIRQLGMPQGRFIVQLETLADQQFTSFGLERVEFQVSANPGQPLQPLAKVASGGELSRISLAIHVLTAQNDATPTLIFDEVDSGIGGGTAEVVGRLLRDLSAHTQVLCVTHLPQVAALGHQHLQINKTLSKKSTKTEVISLDQRAKINEIARMLGGVKITEHTLAHAQEMVENVN